MENLLEIKDAQRQIGESFALRNVDLAVAPGEIVGFVGANGAGKTTTIRVALGLMRLNAGELRLFGEPFGPNAADSTQHRVRSRIGVVFDTCPYPAEFTIAQVERCVTPAFPAWDKAQFWRLAEQFSLSRKAKVKDLSRGMGMKLQLAVALSHKADLLVLDEATAGLDPIARDNVLTALREFAAQEGHGALLSSHITSDLDRVADRVVGIDGGRIIFNMPREEITDMAGIAHCTAEQARAILECVDGAHIERREFSCDVLVPNRFEFAEAFPEIPCDHASIEDYLRFTLKGITQ